MGELISISAYALLNNVEPVTVRAKCQRGGYLTARKIGRNWVIDKDEPYSDNRIKNEKYMKLDNRNKD